VKDGQQGSGGQKNTFHILGAPFGCLSESILFEAMPGAAIGPDVAAGRKARANSSPPGSAELSPGTSVKRCSFVTGAP